MAKYKAGDLVRRKLGGPTMTVKDWTQGPEGQELVECEWEDNGAQQRDNFTDEELEPAG